MPVVIPDEILETTQMKPEEILQELAITLYKQERISLAQAARLAKMNRLQFQHLLASRDLTINFDWEDYEEDLKSIKSHKEWSAEFFDKTEGKWIGDPLVRPDQGDFESRLTLE